MSPQTTLQLLRGLATRVLCACLLLLILVTSFAFAQVKSGLPQSKMDDIFLKADKLRLEGNNEEALKIINGAIWLDSDCGLCFAFRSGILGNLRRFKEGVGDGHTGIQKSKKPREKALAAYNLGFNLAGWNRGSEALSAYEDCIRFDSTFPMCYFGKGKELVAQQAYKEALKALETATTLNPKHGPSWAMRASAEGGVGLLFSSWSSALRAVELAPNDPRSHLALAYAHGLNSMFDEMLADVTKALEIDPQTPHAHLMRAQALKELGRNEESAREFDLEFDRKAVAKVLHPETDIDTRIYNCGNFSTELETPLNFNADGFNECKERVMKQLIESAVPRTPTPKPRPSIPGLPQPKVNKK